MGASCGVTFMPWSLIQVAPQECPVTAPPKCQRKRGLGMLYGRRFSLSSSLKFLWATAATVVLRVKRTPGGRRPREVQLVTETPRAQFPNSPSLQFFLFRCKNNNSDCFCVCETRALLLFGGKEETFLWVFGGKCSMTFCVVSYFFWGGGGFARSRFRKNVGKSKGVFSSCLWIVDWGREKGCFVDSRRRPQFSLPFSLW